MFIASKFKIKTYRNKNNIQLYEIYTNNRHLKHNLKLYNSNFLQLLLKLFMKNKLLSYNSSLFK